MGRSILRTRNERMKYWKGIWQPDDVDRYLKCQGNNFEAQVLSVSCDRRYMDWSYIGRLEKLRLARIADTTFIGVSNPRFPSEMTFLHMINCSRRSSDWWWFMESRTWPIREVDVEGLGKLAVLILENCTSVQLPSNFHRLRSLRILKIHAKELTALPCDFGRLPTLELLHLQCPKLRQLPGSVLQLSKLTNWKLVGCSALTAWPDPRFGVELGLSECPLSCLRKLRLSGASALSELPDSFWLMRSLEELTLESCHALRRLPKGIGKLQRLQMLKISQCDGLIQISKSVGQLKSLRLLHIYGCSSLWYLPDSLGDLEALEDLYVDRTSIRSVPESIGRLRRLKSFQVRNCIHLKCLPGSIGQLDRLRFLLISCCENPESSGRGGKGISVTTEGLEDLQSLSDSLQILEIVNCRRLEMLPISIERLQFLELVNVDGHNVKGPSPFLQEDLTELVWPLFSSLTVKLPTLRWLLFPCKQGVSNWLEHLTYLEELILTNGKVEHLPDSLGDLVALITLNIDTFDCLRTLPESVGRLRSLRHLRIASCSRLENFPESICKLADLNSFIVKRCNHLKTLPASIGHYDKIISLESCNSLQTLPDSLGQRKSCKIYIEGCIQLTSEYLDSLPYEVYRYSIDNG
ncbi:hypothetical protein R1flu_002509 [Riccia fluitans]|uniref:Uncharacterized protein n=1 Tax=Riccia fluitans TaxID=41844 RepID=A0ABD1Y6C2_9MARC